MKVVRILFLTTVAALLISCGRSRYSLEVCLAEVDEHGSQMCRSYQQTDITVAEAGLLSYRSWLTNRMNDPKYQEIADGFPGALLVTEARLWALYEFRGDTNSSERVYERAREASRLDGRWPREPISKTELSNHLRVCDASMDVQWKGITNATQR